MINDKRIAVENLPAYCSATLHHLHGRTPEELKLIIAETGYKFCLDFSHGICASNSLKIDKYKALEDFSKLNPAVYHICDGYFDGVNDEHFHLGKGDYPLKELVEKYSSPNGMLTMETGGYPIGTEPWINDVTFLKNL